MNWRLSKGMVDPNSPRTHPHRSMMDLERNRVLYPDVAAFRQWRLRVSHGHTLCVQEWGSPDGRPALVLHGGPGSGSSPLLGRFFDPSVYRVICVDQRGSGLSEPGGDVAHNRTDLLLDDLHALRRHLMLNRWLVVGGSWGAALALAYAAAEPAAVEGLLLRAVFLARQQDIDWFFQGAQQVRPRAWQDLAHALAAGGSEPLLPLLANALLKGTPEQQARAARAWRAWELSLAQPDVPADPQRPKCPPDGEALSGLIRRYQVQVHYLMHTCWLNDPPLLARCAQVPVVPTLILHGRQDHVCLPQAAAAVHAALPGSRLTWVDDAGHDPTHPAMVDAMVRSLDEHAVHGHFEAAGPHRLS